MLPQRYFNDNSKLSTPELMVLTDVALMLFQRQVVNATQLASVEWLLETGTDPSPIPPHSLYRRWQSERPMKKQLNTEV